MAARPWARVMIRNLGKIYGRKAVLRDISQEFSGLALITGANGSGKSTLLRIIAGLCRPDRGAVALEGKMGYLGHATFIYPDLTARENLAFWAKASGLGKIDLDAALARVGLEKAAGERARVFSRGMAQRLNLARLLLAAPEILLLDEPATGLDGPSRELLRAEIARARSNGACVLLASHDPADAETADHVYTLRGGRLGEA